MYKLLLIMLLLGVWVLAQAEQVQQEMAIQTFFVGKQAVNRSVHAAAQQIDEASLADGSLYIDERAALAVARRYLQEHLQLGDGFEPLPGSRLEERVELTVFEVINGNRQFPYTYRHAETGYEVTLQRPGVVMIIQLAFPPVLAQSEPIVWQIKGTAELVAY